MARAPCGWTPPSSTATGSVSIIVVTGTKPSRSRIDDCRSTRRPRRFRIRVPVQNSARYTTVSVGPTAAPLQQRRTGRAACKSRLPLLEAQPRGAERCCRSCSATTMRSLSLPGRAAPLGLETLREPRLVALLPRPPPPAQQSGRSRSSKSRFAAAILSRKKRQYHNCGDRSDHDGLEVFQHKVPRRSSAPGRSAGGS